MENFGVGRECADMKPRRDTREKYPWMFEMKVCPRCGELKSIGKVNTFCSNSCAKRGMLVGEDNPRWAGDNVTYSGAHRRVKAELGAASTHVCIGCGDPANEWANLTGHYEDIHDYQALCISCHRLYDSPRRRGKRPRVLR